MLALFISYAHADEQYRGELEKHLALLKHEGLIAPWHDHRIVAGQDIDREIDENLERADIILLLVSPDFIHSKYCYDIEMKRAIERHRDGSARVIPVIVRPCDWHSAPFGRLKALPNDGTPISTYANRDQALLEIAQAIRALTDGIESSGSEGTRRNDHVTDVFETLRHAQSCRVLAHAISVRSKDGLELDPQITFQEAIEMMRRVPGVTDAKRELDLIVYELERVGLVKKSDDPNSPSGWDVIGPTDDFFWKTDALFQAWHPSADAREVCKRAEPPDYGFTAHGLAEDLGWEPRRLNSALAFMVAHGLVQASEGYVTHYLFPWGHLTPEGQLFCE